MIDPLQSAHLDADTFSAFAESALPPHEREATLAHLAVCADCRELVQLSIPPHEELQPIATVPTRRGFAWRWVLTSGAVAAVALSAALLLRPHPNTQIAKLESAPATTLSSAPAPAPQAKQAPKPAMTPLPPAAMRSLKPEPPAAVAPPDIFTAPPSARARTTQQLHGAAAPAPVPLPPENRMQLDQRFMALNKQQSQPAQVVLGANAAPPAAPVAPPAAAATVTVEASSQATDMTSLSVSALQLLPELPSHLEVASRYSDGQREIAADTAGTLFLKKKPGHGWKRVKPVWSGKVVQVSAAAAPLANAKPDKHAPAFALVTDTGEHWVSHDGNHWTR